MKKNKKEAIITLVVWLIMSYIFGAFFASSFDTSTWDVEVKKHVLVFGPVVGLFLFVAILFWDDENFGNNHEIL